MARRQRAQRGGFRVRTFTLLTVGGAAAVVSAARAALPSVGPSVRNVVAPTIADSASFVPDDNRAFQFEVARANPLRPRAAAIVLSCGFYDRGGNAVEKRVVAYREAPATALFGFIPSGRWSPIAMCTFPERGSAASRVVTPSERVVVQPSLTIPIARITNGRAGERALLIVAWTRRPDGRWAQLERYSVLRQRAGVMYQFGDFRIDCCLNAASAYVTRIAAPEEASTRSPPAEHAAAARR